MALRRCRSVADNMCDVCLAAQFRYLQSEDVERKVTDCLMILAVYACIRLWIHVARVVNV